MISGLQIREGRALLDWSPSDLAECARIDVQTVTRAEIFEGMPFVTVAQAGAMQCALEAAGIEFIVENERGSEAKRVDVMAAGTDGHELDRYVRVRQETGMRLTSRQRGLLERVDAVELRIKQTGAKGYRLEGEDVTTTMTSLIARRLVEKAASEDKVALTDAGRTALRMLASTPDLSGPTNSAGEV